MVSGEVHQGGEEYDRMSELKAFDETKAGVKGLVDAGLTKVPGIFVDDQVIKCRGNPQFSVPVIDFKDIATRRGEIMEQVKDVCTKWGLFILLNHGIPESVLSEMFEGVRQFHEQDTELKKQYYSRDNKRPFIYNSNCSLYSPAPVDWRDTFECIVSPNPPKPEELPVVIRDIVFEYSSHVMKLGHTLLELLSEGLGLKPNHLKDLDCDKGLMIQGHYYPPCPEPTKTLAASSHTDSGFFTVLLQDTTGGLQLVYENQWVDVPAVPGSLVINLGDLLRLLSNDKFTNAQHRVLAHNQSAPRISVAGFFRMNYQEGMANRIYGPIRELLSEENPPVYRESAISDFLKYRLNAGFNGGSFLSHLKVNKTPLH